MIDGKSMIVNESLVCPDLPIPHGPKHFTSPPASVSKGISADRLAARIMSQVTCPSALALQQTVEMTAIHNGEQLLSDINPNVRKASGLSVHERQKSSKQSTDRRSVKRFRPVKGVTKRRHGGKDPYKYRPCIYNMQNLKPTKVKKNTGFCELRELLCFVALVCDGDFSKMTKRCSYLSWLEEWFFYFHMIYGHGLVRWYDYADKYEISQYILRRVFREKLATVIHSRRQWPLFATYAEDIKLRKDSWNELFPPQNGVRVIEHDTTDTRMLKPSDPALQRALYNDYYGGCVGKGGIGIQLCGWTVAFELCTGAISDTSYVKTVNIFELQNMFAKNDLTSPNPFLNVFDKGYRLVSEAEQNGKQTCIQPTFVNSDQRFSTVDVLSSAAVAAVRSGNERAVRQVKLSWMIKRGCAYGGYEFNTIADIWLAWGYQLNFMYDAVH